MRNQLAAESVRFKVWLACGFMLMVCGESSGTSAESEILEGDVGTVIANVLDGWHHADASEIAGQYEATGDFISPNGQHAVGRHAIEAFYQGAFAAGYAGSRATATVLHARNVAAAVALVDGSWTITPTAASKITRLESGLFVAVLRRHGGRWWIVALREQTSARRLHEL